MTSAFHRPALLCNSQSGSFDSALLDAISAAASGMSSSGRVKTAASGAPCAAQASLIASSRADSKRPLWLLHRRAGRWKALVIIPFYARSGKRWRFRSCRSGARPPVGIAWPPHAILFAVSLTCRARG